MIKGMLTEYMETLAKSPIDVPKEHKKSVEAGKVEYSDKELTSWENNE